MEFKKIQLNGFKSFAEKTNFLIEEGLTGITENAFLMLMIIAVILIITGMFMESIAQIILLTPLLLPLVQNLGVHPIAVGIIMVIACEVGFLTPPVGANLFVAARITNRDRQNINCCFAFCICLSGYTNSNCSFPRYNYSCT